MEESIAALLNVFSLPVNDEYIGKYKDILSTSASNQPISDAEKETYKKKLRTVIKNYNDYQAKEQELTDDNPQLCDNINEFLYHLSGNYAIRGKIKVAKISEANKSTKISSTQRSVTPSTSSRSSFSSPYRPSNSTTGRSSSVMSRTSTISDSPLLKDKTLSSFASSTTTGSTTTTTTNINPSSSFAIKAPPLKGFPTRTSTTTSSHQPLKSTVNPKMFSSTTKSSTTSSSSTSSQSSNMSSSLLNRPEFSASTERTPSKNRNEYNNNNSFLSPTRQPHSASKIKSLGIINHAVVDDNNNNEEEEEVRRQLYELRQQQQQQLESERNEGEDESSSESEEEEKKPFKSPHKTALELSQYHEESINPTFITYNSYVTIRSYYGTYLQNNNFNNNNNSNIALNCNGDGTGDENQTFLILNVNDLSSQSPVKYNDTICLRNLKSKKFLSVNNKTNEIIFDNNITTYSKWDIMGKSGNIMKSKYIKYGEEIVFRSFNTSYLKCEEINTSLLVKRKLNLLLLIPTLNPSDLTTFSNSINLQEVWSIVKLGTPYIPIWSLDRPFLNGNYIFEKLDLTPQPLNSQPIQIQEQTIIDELLSALMGIPGDYIIIMNNNDKNNDFEGFILNTNINQSFQYLVNKILPLCNDYVKINSFIINEESRYEYGKISHSLCSSIKMLIKEYFLLITQLEQQFREGILTLQKMWYYLQPSIRTFDILMQCVEKSRNLIGGQLINSIYEVSNICCDEKGKSLYLYLMKSITKPFFEMLSDWIFNGEILDPHNEFMIHENLFNKVDLKSSNYWEDCYIIDQGHVPIFLNDLSEKILSSGKYLNAIRMCTDRKGNNVICPFQTELKFTEHSRDYIEPIEQAYKFSSQALLDVLLKECNLTQHLETIKHYYLIDEEDWFIQFYTNTMENNYLFRRKVSDIDINKLNLLLTQSIALSASSDDRFRHNITCDFDKFTINQYIQFIQQNNENNQIIVNPIPEGIRPDENLPAELLFKLNYKIEFPLSLLFTPDIIFKYQMIFRHLFYSKHVERQLYLLWIKQQEIKELNISQEMKKNYCLRQKMLHFIQNFNYYLLHDVIDIKYFIVQKELENAKTIDEMLIKHNNFLSQCLKECLLTEPKLYKLIAKIYTTILQFVAQNISWLNRFEQDKENISVDETYYAPSGSPAFHKARCDVEALHLQRLVGQEQYRNMISTSETNFNKLIGGLLIYLKRESPKNFNSHLGDLFDRLNYNEFYSDTQRSKINIESRKL